MIREMKRIGVALVALCALWAVSASAAQAAAPHWTTGTADPFGGPAEIQEQVTLMPRVAGESPATAELTVPGLGITLNSSNVKITGGKVTSSTAATGKISFLSVTATGLPNCLVHSVGAAAGTVTTEPTTATLSGESPAYATFAPTSGTKFVSVVIEPVSGKSCGVSGSYEVTGVAALQVRTNSMEEKIEASSSEAIQKASGKALNFGAKPAYLDIVGTLGLKTIPIWGVHTGTP